MIVADREVDMAWNSMWSYRLAALVVASVILVSATAMVPLQREDDPLPATTALSDTAGAVSVTVRDDMGRPMSGAGVAIIGTNRSGTTNDTGVVYFDDLPTDPFGVEYTAYANKTGYIPSGIVEATVTPWNVTYINLTIVGGVIYGVVEDSLGPIPNATVSVPTLGYSNVTGVDGVYSIRGVPGNVNPYAVSVVASGYVNQTKEIVLGVGDFEILNFLMASLTGAISGTVLHATSEVPLPGVAVSVRVGTVTLTVDTETDGTYWLPDLPSGTYTVTATMTGFESGSVAGVVVVSGSITEGVDFLLVELPTMLFGVVRSGTLLVPGVLLNVVGTDIFTNTSTEGSYEIVNITAGIYDITASKEGYVSLTIVGVTIPMGGQKELNIDIEALPGSSLSGVVLSGDDEDPLTGVEVVVIGLATKRSTITNVYGQFEVTGLLAGNYTVRFILDGFKPQELGPVYVPQDGSATLEQVLLEPVQDSFGGFIFGFDLAHSMMILALFLTIIILAFAVLLRIKTFEAPDKAPAVYDDQDEEELEGATDAKRKEAQRRDMSQQPRKKDKRRK